MDNVLIDRTTLYRRRSLGVVNGGASVRLFGSPPLPLYSSLPSFPVVPPPLPPLQQPPLLPLPFSNSAALPSATKRITSLAAAAAVVRPRPHQKKLRGSVGPRKGPRSSKAVRSDQKPVRTSQAVVEGEEGGEKESGEFLGRSLYSISPPPSSLPLPRFSLVRPKDVVASASCIAEATGGGGGGVRVDGGATGDLRHLFRL